MSLKDRLIDALEKGGLVEKSGAPAPKKPAPSSNAPPDVDEIFRQALNKPPGAVTPPPPATPNGSPGTTPPAPPQAPYNIPPPPQGPIAIQHIPIQVPQAPAPTAGQNTSPPVNPVAAPPPQPGSTVSPVTSYIPTAVLPRVHIAPVVSPPPSVPSPPILNLPPSPIVANPGVDLPAIYQKYSVPATPFSAEKVLAMLSKLRGKPLDTAREAVELAITVSDEPDVTIEKIIEDARAKISALAAFAAEISQSASVGIRDSQVEIAELQQKITEKQKAIDTERRRVAAVAQACQAESSRLDAVLQLFDPGLAQPGSAGGAP
jgi:hypothetical protein